jgi:hypothetical protein
LTRTIYTKFPAELGRRRRAASQKSWRTRQNMKKSAEIRDVSRGETNENKRDPRGRKPVPAAGATWRVDFAARD